MSGTKKRPSYGSFLMQGMPAEHAQMKCRTAISVDWRNLLSAGSLSASRGFDPETADEVDPFDMLDLIGSGSPEAKGGQASAVNGEVNGAPCHRCGVDTCPGSTGECLLEADPPRALGAVEDDTEAYIT